MVKNMNHGSILIAGIRDVQSILEHNPDALIEIHISSRRRDAKIKSIAGRARKLSIPVMEQDIDLLDKMVPGVRHQGVVARSQPLSQPESLESLLQNLDHPPLILVLDGVQDPHNLGACLRSADGAGVDALVVPADGACSITPVVTRVAAGAAHSIPIFRVTNLRRSLEQMQKQGVWLVGTSDQAEATLWQTDLTGPLALVMGSEGDGLRALTQKQCDYLVQIPMQGVVESLNVSVATGVLLFEALRQRQTP